MTKGVSTLKRGGRQHQAGPAEPATLLRVFELFAEHRRKKTVAKVLNGEGHRTQQGALFTDTAVGRLLKTPRQNISAIVPAELYDRCADLLDDRKEGGVLRKPSYLFAGLATCACGSKMYVPSNSPKYVCPTCRNKIALADLEAVYIEYFKNRVLMAAAEHQRETENPDAEDLSFGDIWPKLDSDERRRLVELLTPIVEIGEGKIRFRVADSLETVAVSQQSQTAEKLVREKAASGVSSLPALERIRLDVSARELYQGTDRLTGKLSETTRNFLSVLGYQIVNRIDAPLPWDEPFSENATATAASAVRMLRKQLGADLARLILKLERKRGEKPGGVRLVNVEIAGSGRRDFLTQG